MSTIVQQLHGQPLLPIWHLYVPELTLSTFGGTIPRRLSNWKQRMHPNWHEWDCLHEDAWTTSAFHVAAFPMDLRFSIPCEWSLKLEPQSSKVCNQLSTWPFLLNYNSWFLHYFSDKRAFFAIQISITKHIRPNAKEISFITIMRSDPWPGDCHFMYRYVKRRLYTAVMSTIRSSMHSFPHIR